MNPTERLLNLLNARWAELVDAVFKGELNETIYLWAAQFFEDQKITVEEMGFLDGQISQINGQILKLISQLKVGQTVRVLRPGREFGQNGRIVQILGLTGGRNKSHIRYRVELRDKDRTYIEEYMVFELEPFRLPKSLSAPSWKRPGPPLTPANRPRL